MFNVKDLPTAAGVVLTLWGLVVLSRPLSYIGPKGVAGAVGLLAVGGIISVGTRPGTWLLVSGLALTLLAGTWWTVTPKIGLLASSRLALARLAGLALAAGAAMAVLGLVYPRLFGSPIEALIRSARVSSDYGGWSGWTLTAGVVHGQPPPWWYLPSWFGAQLPLLVLVLGAVGAAVVLVSALRVAARRGHPAQDVEIGWILVLVAGTAAPVVAVVSGATVYTGIRQLLFVLPPIALLAVRGLATALRVADPVSLKSPHVRGVAWVAVVLGLLAPTFDQARLFPYGYVYLNEMATLRPVDGSWPTDYWRASFRELLVQVPSTGPLACSLAAEQDGVRNRGAALRFEERRVSACSRLVDPARDGRDLRGSLLGGEFWYLRQNQFGRDLPSNCVVEGEVVRTLRGQQLLMSYLARCTDPTHLPN
jgi:hypothetical protein